MSHSLELERTAVLDRPVRLKMRPDLLVTRQIVSGKHAYFIKDPISLAHHQLWEEEFELLQLLDGKTTLRTMKQLFEEKYRPAKLDFRLLERLHGHFFRSGLIVSRQPGQGEQLWERHQSQRTSTGPMGWLRLLSYRWRGFNPNRLLDKIEGWFGWTLSLQALGVFAAVLSATAIFILLHWREAQLKLPAWESLFQMDQLIGTLCVFVGMKIVHELSHGMACKHFGGECNEIGIVFYALTPSLYCDVSDSWMIVNKWQRASVAAAGVGAELVMATIAVWIWWLSHPGLLHDLAFQALLIGTVSTVLVNANPLMRFDGYFVLSDLLEVPNLWVRAKRMVESFFSAIFFADKRRDSLEETRLRKTLLLLYGMASMVYRTILTGMVLWFLYQLCFQWRMELLGVGLVSMIAFSFTAHFGLRLRSFFASGGHHRKLRIGRTLLIGLLGVTAVSIFLLVPLPKSVQAKVVFHFADTEKVITSVEGRLEHALPEGTAVVQGDEIAVLTSPSLQLQCSVRRGELARLQAKLEGLEALRNRDPSASAWIPATEESIAGLRDELVQLESESAQLRVRSPRDGVILAGATKQMADTVEGIETWSGSLLHSSNVGCLVPAGTQICLVGPCHDLEAFALIDSSDIELVAAGQTVRLRSHQVPGRTLQGTVSEVGQWSRKERTKLDQTNGSRGDLFPDDWIRDSAGQILYVVRVRIDDADDLLLEQAHGIATIAVAPKTLFSRFARLFHSTFSFEPRAQGRQPR